MIDIEIDLDRCCGAGTCVLRAPEVFDQDDRDGTVVVLAEHPGDDLAESVARAAEECPAGAIRVARRPAPGGVVA